MSRYFTKPKSWAADILPAEDWVTPDTPTVSDHRGDVIMRAPNPVGFIWRDE